MVYHRFKVKVCKKETKRLRSIFLAIILYMLNLSTKKFVHLTIVLLAAVFIQSCASLSSSPAAKTIAKKTTKKISPNIKSSLPPKYKDFDKKPFPNESFVIANMISIVQPELASEDRDNVAVQISKALNKYKVEPQIVVAIIDTESNFKSDMVSSTGDLSVAQINVDVWNKEFVRMNKPAMSKKKIQKDQSYALMKMAEILSIIKKRHGKKDRRWYARYHSNTHAHKKDYLHKLEIRLKMLATADNLNTKLAQSN